MENLAADFIIDFNNPIEAEFELSEGGYDCSFELFASGTVWGSISGTLSNQTDLQAALDLKADKTELNTAVSELNTAIQNEATTRAENDTLLQNNINAEALTRQNADTTLQSNIDTLTDTVSDNDTAINNKVDGINTTLTNSINNLSNTVTSNYNSLDARITTNTGNIATNAGNITTINSKIPNQASSSNQLADKDFVNSSIATNTANFIGTFNSVAELEAYTGTLTNNDYAFVATTDAVGNTLYDRYKWNGSEWLFEYELNNSSFTAAQWASINSGATSTNIGQITINANNIADLQTNKQDVISDLTTIRSNALAGKNASDTIATYGNIVTHNVSEFATSSQGALADTALQPNDNISELTNDAGYITAASLPTVNNGTLTIQANGTTVGTFTANQSGNTTANIVVPDSATWGNISGTLSNQTDLQSALDAKQDVLTSENAGNCIEITIGSSSGLPAEYQEVEYLDSTGTQYIDTGITPTATKLRVVTKCQRLANTKGGDYLGSVTSTTPRAGFRLFNNGNSGNLVIQATTSIDVNTSVTDILDCDVTVIQNTSCSYKVNNISNTIRDNTINLTFNKSLILYGFHFGDDVTVNSIPQRFWGFTVYKEDVLIQNLVPARRKSDSVLGMYDTVSGDFLPNAGTGTFIAGQDVEETTKISFVNDAGYITGITSSDVTTALGYTPYNATNPNSYITASALNGYATEQWVTNQNYVNGTTLANTLADYVLSASLSSVATSGDYNDLSNKPTIPSEVTESTVSGWGFTKNTGTVTSVNNVSPVNGNVSLTIPDTSNLANKDLSNLSNTGNSKFQAPLVSGTNIKTINNNSILGSGNLVLDGLPTQTGNNGKFLTTDGTDASWGVVKTHNLLEFKWSDHLLDDISWLRADTFSWQSGGVYTSAYNHLVQDIQDITAETETIGSYTVTFYRATDGHKIALADQETTIANIYSETGIAWYYILDTTNTQFKLPRTKYGFEGLRTNVGDKIDESLPNITGTLGLGIDGGDNKLNYVSSTGALTTTSYSGKGGTTGDTTYTVCDGVNLNASLSSSVYQDNAPVQERATQMYLYFYVGDYSQTAIEQTAGLNSELFNGKVDKADLQEVQCVVETYKNGTSWYRVYSDGWCEQGGRYTGSLPTQINLLKSYVNSNYDIVTQCANKDNINWNGNPITVSFSSRTTSYFLATVYGDYSNIALSWQACGYIEV